MKFTDTCAKPLAVFVLLAATAGFTASAEQSSAALLPELDCVVQPSEVIDIGSAVPGLVKQLHVDRNDLVTKGATVAALESGVEQAAVNLAMARAKINTEIELQKESAAFGRMTVRRNQKLLHNASISMQDMDQLQHETRIAEMRVRQAQDNKHIAMLEYQRARAILERLTIRSPIDGVVIERFKLPGEYVDEKPMLRLAKLDPLHVEVIVPVEHLGQITPGMHAEVTAVLPGAQPYLATVDQVDRVADAASGTFGVRLTLPNPDYTIPAGLRCKMQFSSSTLLTVVGKDDVAVPEPAPILEAAPAPMLELEAEPEVPLLRDVVTLDIAAPSCFRVGPFAKKSQLAQLMYSIESESPDLLLNPWQDAGVVKHHLVLAAETSSRQKLG
jgi:RND family efflux transporter MFP subunit